MVSIVFASRNTTDEQRRIVRILESQTSVGDDWTDEEWEAFDREECNGQYANEQYEEVSLVREQSLLAMFEGYGYVSQEGVM